MSRRRVDAPAQVVGVVIDERGVEATEDARPRLDERDLNQRNRITATHNTPKEGRDAQSLTGRSHLDEGREVGVPSRHIAIKEVCELRGEFARGGAAADDHEREEAAALGVGDDRRGGALEALEHAVADLTRVVEVLQEEDLATLALGDAAHAEGVRLAARGDDEVVVPHLQIVGRLLQAAGPALDEGPSTLSGRRREVAPRIRFP